jgi:hypothetical protein
MIYIVINRHRVAANRKVAPFDRQPVVRVTRGKHGKPFYCHSLVFHGTTELLNGNGDPVMPCGATIAQRTDKPVTITVNPWRDCPEGMSETLT